MRRIHVLAALLSGLLFILPSCGDSNGGGGFNIFTLSDDIALGAQVAAEIEADPQNFPVLDSAQYPEAYGHIYRIRDSILNSGEVVHKNDFRWQIRIINDTVLNAFCTPGGYIYVYTGLIRFLEAENELAGVLGHEIAHADERHSTEALTKAYGIEVLLQVVLGENQNVLTDIAKGLVNLSYSRANESESDLRSVDYLYPTAYDARGAARFFEKMIALGGGSIPEFLSTHPNPENRVEAIIAHWEQLGGKEGETFVSRYQQLINSLP